MGGPQHDPHPPEVVELEMGLVCQIDVRGVHVALSQQPPRRTQRVTLGDEIAVPGDDRLDDTRARQGAQPVTRS